MQTIDNGDGTYTHTITPDDISVADMARMMLSYGAYAPLVQRHPPPRPIAVIAAEIRRATVPALRAEDC